MNFLINTPLTPLGISKYTCKSYGKLANLKMHFFTIRKVAGHAYKTIYGEIKHAKEWVIEGTPYVEFFNAKELHSHGIYIYRNQNYS